MRKEYRYGRKVQQLREARAWTQEHLAEAAGIERTRTIQRVEKDLTRNPETLQAIAGAFNVELDTLRSTYLIAESRMVSARLVKTVEDFLSTENNQAWHAFSRPIMAPLKPESEGGVRDLVAQVFANRELIEYQEPGMWESYLEYVQGPLQELFDLGFAFFLLDENRDVLLKSIPGLGRPSTDHIPDWIVRHYVLVAPHGCFQLDENSPLHKYNENCRSAGETLLTLLNRSDNTGVWLYTNALWALGVPFQSKKICWCDVCFPSSPSGERIGLDYIEQVTGIRREQLHTLYESVMGEPFLEGLS